MHQINVKVITYHLILNTLYMHKFQFDVNFANSVATDILLVE